MTMETIAVTGGIGSGKSLVCRYLRDSGIPVYDSDSGTKALYVSDVRLREAVRSAMSGFCGGNADCLFRSDGHLDLKALAKLVFSRKEALEALEAVVHPAVLEDFIRWRSSAVVSNAALYGAVAIESAIILEKPLFRGIADKVILVDASPDVRVRRVMLRDGAAISEVEDRIRNQRIFYEISAGRLKPEADYVIENNGAPEELRRKVDEFIDSNYRK